MSRFAMSTTFGRVPYVLPWKTAAHEGAEAELDGVDGVLFSLPSRMGEMEGQDA